MQAVRVFDYLEKKEDRKFQLLRMSLMRTFERNNYVLSKDLGKQKSVWSR